MSVVTYRKFFYTFSAVLVALSLVALLVFGLHLGIDFKGGSIMEVSYPDTRPDASLVERNLSSLGLTDVSVRPTGTNGFIVRTPFLAESARESLTVALSDKAKYPVKIDQFDSIGPSVGGELRSKSLLSVGLVMLAIVLFISFAFRKVSEPVASWKYGLVAVVGLIHNLIVPIGFSVFLGPFRSARVDALFGTPLPASLRFSGDQP